MNISNLVAVTFLGLAMTSAVWADCPCYNGDGCGWDDGERGAAVVGAGVPGEKIDFSENAVFIEDIAVYDAQVSVNANNVVVDAAGKPAKPVTGFILRGDKAQSGFKVIGRDTKGNYKVLADDAHTCVGWVNNVDYSRYVKLGSDSRSLRFVSVHPGAMRLMVSYQTVPGSSTPIQKVLNVCCVGPAR